MEKSTSTARPIEVSASDLPLHCPTPNMPKWSSHPRVFLDVERTGHAVCPYCGNEYHLQGGPRAGHGH